MSINRSESERDAESAHRFDALSNALRQLCDHTRREPAQLVWPLLIANVQRVREQWVTLTLTMASKAKAASSSSSHNRELTQASVNLWRAVHFVHVWVSHRWGTRVGGKSFSSIIYAILFSSKFLSLIFECFFFGNCVTDATPLIALLRSLLEPSILLHASHVPQTVEAILALFVSVWKSQKDGLFLRMSHHETFSMIFVTHLF